MSHQLGEQLGNHRCQLMEQQQVHHKSILQEQPQGNHRCLLLEQLLGNHRCLLQGVQLVHTGIDLVQAEFEFLVWVLEDHRLVQVQNSLELEHYTIVLEHYMMEVEHYKQVLEHCKMGLEHYRKVQEHCRMGLEHHLMVLGLAWQVFLCIAATQKVENTLLEVNEWTGNPPYQGAKSGLPSLSFNLCAQGGHHQAGNYHQESSYQHVGILNSVQKQTFNFVFLVQGVQLVGK